MSTKERLFRGLTEAMLCSPVATVVHLWFVPVVLAGLLGAFYFVWWAGYSSALSDRYVAAWLGAGIDTKGGDNPIYPGRPYLLVGPRFQQRIARREASLRILRIAGLERELGMARSYDDSAYQREAREVVLR